MRVEFQAALVNNPDAARRYLPLVIDQPWLGEVNFRDACAFARGSAEEPAAGLAEKVVRAIGLRNPDLALRETAEYLPLANGHRLLEEFVHAAPDEAMGMAAGSSKSARALRELMSGAGSPELALLVRLADERGIDLPRRRRMAILGKRIARGDLAFDAALKIAGDTPRFFATVVDMRAAAVGADAAPLERALENESLVLCRAARESLQRTVAGDLAHFRTRDLFVLLALGRAEAIPEVFAPVFDRLLLPKWKAEAPKGRSLLALLDQTKNWELRDFAAGVVAARRFDGLLSIAGPELVDRLARGIDRTADPLKEGMRLAEIVDATTGASLLRQFASIVAEEFTRCREAGDARGTTIYGLLAARLSVSAIAAPYLPFFRSSESLDTALLYGAENLCIERHFFYDDDDGVKSFASFLGMYDHDPDWEIEDRGPYVRLTGRGPEGRRIEIFANVPIDGHLPKNQNLAGEAQRRQQAITAALDARGLAPTVIVHRGHSFWVERTISYVAKTARLVILGSCGGADQIHEVLEASHEAQVIATRGVGTTGINDSLLKALNDRILKGERTIEWNGFWRELGGNRGSGALFREYLAPNRDTSAVFLRAYYRFFDAMN